MAEQVPQRLVGVDRLVGGRGGPTPRLTTAVRTSARRHGQRANRHGAGKGTSDAGR